MRRLVRRYIVSGMLAVGRWRGVWICLDFGGASSDLWRVGRGVVA